MLEGIKIGLIKLLKRFRTTSTIYGLHQQVKKGYLGKWGWPESWYLKRAQDKEGNPIPWLTYPAIDFLSDRLNNTIRVFEYGSGSSTSWFVNKVGSIISCEHDFDWYEIVKAELGDNPNANLVFRDLEKGADYEEEVLNQNKRFDLILIDGRRRNSCGANSIRALSDTGVIIWDNSDRSEYQQGIAKLLESGFKRLDFYGPAPGSFRESCTTIFYRADNILGI